MFQRYRSYKRLFSLNSSMVGALNSVMHLRYFTASVKVQKLYRLKYAHSLQRGGCIVTTLCRWVSNNMKHIMKICLWFFEAEPQWSLGCSNSWTFTLVQMGIWLWLMRLRRNSGPIRLQRIANNRRSLSCVAKSLSNSHGCSHLFLNHCIVCRKLKR